MALWRRLLAELLGSAFLAAAVVGSGIAAQRLSPGDAGLELLENAVATAAGLYAVILMFGPVSGGHFNPVVSFADAAFGGLRWQDAAAYLPAQVAGCTGGAVLLAPASSYPTRAPGPALRRPPTAASTGESRTTAGDLMHLIAIGGSDAGISAALRARESGPGCEVTVVVADAYPNFSICGIPYYVSGEAPHWRNLAHRTGADLEAAGLGPRLDTTARRVDVPGRKVRSRRAPTPGPGMSGRHFRLSRRDRPPADPSQPLPAALRRY
jgi:hypothetical protein